jgi:hypothetical protein
VHILGQVPRDDGHAQTPVGQLVGDGQAEYCGAGASAGTLVWTTRGPVTERTLERRYGLEPSLTA